MEKLKDVLTEISYLIEWNVLIEENTIYYTATSPYITVKGERNYHHNEVVSDVALDIIGFVLDKMWKEYGRTN